MFTLDELITKFDLAQVNKAGAVFDSKKLDWMNAEYIKNSDIDTLFDLIQEGNFLKELIRNAPAALQTEEFLKRVLTIQQDRLTKLSEFGEQNTFSETLHYEKELLAERNTLALAEVALKKSYEILVNLDTSVWNNYAELERILLEAAGDKRGGFSLAAPCRFVWGPALAPRFDCAWVLGRQISLARIQFAQAQCAI